MTNQSGSAAWTCPNCGAMASILDATCPNCRTARTLTPTAQPAMQSVVGTPTVPLTAVVAVGAAGVLGWLGRYMDQKPRSQPGAKPASRIVAIVLAFVLGFVGAQYFYMGRRILAVLSVLFCWTGYPAVIGMLDGMRMLFMSDREFRQQCT